jgi:hypothetical protein
MNQTNRKFNEKLTTLGLRMRSSTRVVSVKRRWPCPVYQAPRSLLLNEVLSGRFMVMLCDLCRVTPTVIVLIEYYITEVSQLVDQGPFIAVWL